MTVNIKKGKAIGSVTAPPSKSYAHRLLMGSALCEDKCAVSGVAMSRDITATLNCLKNLGIEYKAEKETVTFSGRKKLTVLDDLDCIESGSTLRFFIPLALTTGEQVTFKGTERLISRGIGIYRDILDGVEFTFSETSITARGKLKSGNYALKGDVSSQFVTGLMYALPLLDGDSVIKILPPVESKSYIDMTVLALSSFGIKIEEINENEYKIYGNQKYMANEQKVEGDWSNSAFLYALNSVGGSVEINGLNENSLQGDKVCVSALNKLEKGFAEIDISNCPDLAPILFAVSAVKHGALFTGTKRLKIKESDRAGVMKEELSKFGVEVVVEENSVKVIGGSFRAPTKTLFGHNDHRIVMSMAVLSTLTGGKIDGYEAVSKSYPNFFEVLQKLGIVVDYEN